MRRLQWSEARGAAIAFVAIIAFTWFGGTLALGAHPWWAARIGYIGSGLGLAVWLGLRIGGLSGRATLLAATAGLLAAAVLTWFGKTRFAASFAEDALAGRLWFFGSIAVMAAAFAVLASLASLASANRRPAA